LILWDAVTTVREYDANNGRLVRVLSTAGMAEFPKAPAKLVRRHLVARDHLWPRHEARVAGIQHVPNHHAVIAGHRRDVPHWIDRRRVTFGHETQDALPRRSQHRPCQ
jgi:hypothetical protein